MTEIEKFIDTVKRMREAQKEYFKTRDRKVLIHSKCLEGAVDKMILDYEATKKPALKQAELFPE